MMDNKGRIFGKINIIDLLVILMVLAVGVLLAVKLTGADPVSPTGTAAVYTVKVDNVDQAVYDSVLAMVSEGPQQLMSSGEMVDAYITGMTAESGTSELTVATGSDSSYLSYRDDLLSVTFTIEAMITEPVLHTVGSQEVRVGKSHIVKTVNLEMEQKGIITSFAWKE